MRLTKTYILPLILIITLLPSCKECAYDYKYEVRNETSSEIKIIWAQKQYSLDSVTIEPKETKTLFIIGHGIEPCGDIPVFSDVDQDLESFKAIKLDSGKYVSNLNYLSNDSWEYSDGTYSATITETEF